MGAEKHGGSQEGRSGRGPGGGRGGARGSGGRSGLRAFGERRARGGRRTGDGDGQNRHDERGDPRRGAW